jgi:polyvinyl alcohol dehydrogenase (cytochrome)
MTDIRIGRLCILSKIGGARKAFALSALAFIVTGAGVVIGAGTVTSAQNENAAVNPGQALYREHCGSCHDGGASRAPSRAALEQMSVENIRFALTKGSMSSQGANLTPAQVDALAGYLSKLDELKAQGPTDTNLCPQGGPAFSPSTDQPHWNGWGVDATQRRFQPAQMAGLRADQVPKLKLKWAFGYASANQAYAQPAIVGGRIFVGSVARKVYSLDAKSGCIYWIIDTDFAVRTAISVGADGDGWAGYFGDQHGNVYAVDALTGKVLWKTSLDPHPDVHVTGAPTLADGRLYVGVSSLEEVSGADAKDECCKFRGSVSSLDAATGKVFWKSYTIAAEPQPVRKNAQGVQLWGPSGAGIWSSPTVDLQSRMVYVTTGDNYSDPATNTSDAFMAFDLETGKLVWSSQMSKGDAYNIDCDIPADKQSNCPEAKGPDFDFGSSAILVNLPNGHRALIAGAKSGIVYAVDPDARGKLLWQKRVGQGGSLGGVQWGSAADANNVYVALSDVVRRAAAPASPAGQDSVFGVPYELDPKVGGGLFALKVGSGETAWQRPHPPCVKPGCSPAQSAAVSVIPGVVFSGGVDGHLRAYSAKDGRIIWDVDTEREYKTVNGVKANGGSLDESGPVIVGGVLYVNSGYFFQGSTAGNVLLAFSVDGK